MCIKKLTIDKQIQTYIGMYIMNDKFIGWKAKYLLKKVSINN